MNSRQFEDIYPLSPLQEGMLFHTLYEPGSGAYVTQLSCQLQGLEIGAFRRAWERVVARHPTLRTAYTWKSAKRPMQVVVRELELPLALEDWRGRPREELAAALEAYLEADRERGFDLSKPPLMRLVLIRTGERQYQMIWSHHHLLLDGWSLSLVLGEVAAFYKAFLRGEEADGAGVRPFRDFIGWLQQQDVGEIEGFWRRRLDGFESPLKLWVDRGAAQGEGVQRREQIARLSAAASSALVAACRRQRLTLSTVLQGAWALLLSRYSGARDVVFGSVVSGRPPDLEGVESMVGLFINTLPVRVAVDSGRASRDWLRELQEQQLEQRQFEHSPLSQVQRWSAVPPGEPLFETLFAFENFPVDEMVQSALGSLDVSDFRSADYSNYPLSFGSWPEPELPLYIDYDERRFESSSVIRMLGHLRELLESMVSDAGRRLGELSMLSAAERRQVLVEWNATASIYPQWECIHELFGEQAALHRDRPAVVWEDGWWSFGELEGRAGSLARHLRGLGVGPEERVGLSVERSPELAVGLLGIVAAGGVYVPLDPGLPFERRLEMVRDSGARVVVTGEGWGAGLAEHGVTVVEVSRASEEAGAPLGDGAPVSPQNLAYVIYTSGSTGEPKGVGISHSSLVNFAVSAREVFALDATDRVLQFSPLGFNVVMEELFPAWLAGAAVVFHRGVEGLSCAELGGVIARYGVTGLELPAGYWHEWVRQMEEAGEGPPASLRWLILGCEKPLAERVEQWEGCGLPLINVFGLTETTVTSTVCRTLGGEGQRDVPIGRPIANTQVYVLDDELSPVAVGLGGELYLGGEGVGRGYLGRAAATAERFVPDPFAVSPGSRLYKTGDLARYRMDGNLEFLGRLDRQLKVRGFRVEPREIEGVLSRHPGVCEVAVVGRELGGGSQGLVAYVVAREGAEEDPEAHVLVERLRLYLEPRLARHLIPSAFVVVEALPWTRSGKLDVAALPAPQMRPVSQRVAPRNAVEETLAEVWSQVLGVERVGVEDNFFALGGDSILSLQIVSRAQRAGVRVTPRQLFEHPTIAGLASVAERAEERAVEPQAAVEGPVPLTPIQRWFFAQELASPAHWNMPLLLELRRAWEPGAIASSLAKLAEHHDALRLRYRRGASGWEQSNAGTREGTVPFATVDLSELSESASREALAAVAGRVQASLDLGAGPLLRAVLFRGGPAGSDRLLLMAHHLVVDGVSWRILLEDLATACEAASRGERVVLPAKTTSFQAWSQRLEVHARSAALAEELPYWLEQTGGELAALPVDGEGASTQGSRAVVKVELGPSETQALLQQVPRVYRTEINDVLLTALSRSLEAWLGGRPVLVDLEGHGREEVFAGADLSRTVGWLATLYPVRLESTETLEPGAGLKALKQRLRRVPQRGLGYGLLRYGLGAEALEGRKAEVLFNYLGQLDLALAPSSPFSLSSEDIGEALAPAGERSHLLEINAGVEGGRLSVEWSYSCERHERATVERLAQSFVAELSALVEHCLSEGAGGYTPSDFALARLTQGELDRVVTREIEDLYPLSPLQQGMVFHSLLAPEQAVYFCQSVFGLEGSVDTARFREAWQGVVARHGSLRTRFVWEGLDQPLQVVERSVEVPWREEDWRSLSASEQERLLAEYLREDLARPLDLDRAPLMRVAVFRSGEEAYRLVWSYNQGLLDGWSLPVVFGDLFALYRSLGRGEEAHLDRPGSYKSYIAWLQQQELSRAEAYWRRSLAGFTAPTPLGAASVRAGAEETHTEVHSLLPEPLTADLEALARQYELTLNTLMQGAWALLLHHTSGERDVIFGATVAGRPPQLDGVESIVGVFINTLPVRIAVDLRATVAGWLRGIQAQQAEMRQFEHSPLVEIQGWSEVSRSQPLFESILVFENYPVTETLRDSDPGFAVRPLAGREQTNYPITVTVEPRKSLFIEIEHDRRRFERTAVVRMIRHLQGLLEGFVHGPDRRLSELPLLTAGERHQLLVEANDSERLWVRAEPVQVQFERQAASCPARVVLGCEGEQWSYGEVNRRANRLAWRLLELGVGPEAVVGLLTRRGVELLAPMLAILKAGGAYQPMDPAHPALRHRQTVEQSRTGLLLVEREWLPRLEEGLAGLEPEARPRVRVIEELLGAGFEEENPPRRAVPANLAYVIYTSGSTGVPKGVMIDHRGLSNHLWANIEALGMGPADVLAQTASQCFDISVWQYLAPLVVGGRIEVFGDEMVHDPPGLLSAVDRQRVTVLEVVPSVIASMVLEPESWSGDRPGLSALRFLLPTGEALTPELCRRWFDQFPRVPLVNAYGPAECSDDVTLSFLYAAPGDDEHQVSIGRPVANLGVYLLDRELRPVAPGVAGELCVRGVGVGRGYLNRPGRTAQAFVPDPFGGEPGGRLYRSGDLARSRPDGELEYAGRLDHQVKVRGQRLELGEVEAVLRQHPAVSEAVATVREDTPGEPRLVAYLIASAAPERRELREFLGARVPDAMIPGSFVFLEAFPRTANGKLDRAALPAPEAPLAAHVAPRTEIEAELVAVWQEVLGVPGLGVEDSFFDLGGHSLVATKLISRVRQRLRVEVPLRSLFDRPTVAGLALTVAQIRAAQTEQDEVVRLLAEIEALSDAEAQSLLAARAEPLH